MDIASVITFFWLRPCMQKNKSELYKAVDLSLCGLVPAQSQMDLFLDTLCARKKQWAANFNQSGEAM